MANNANSLSHTKLVCKYHIVFTPKYRRKAIYNQYKVSIRDILKQLCAYKGVEIIEGHLMADHVHMIVSIPPKMSVSSFMGYLKGKLKFQRSESGRRILFRQDLLNYLDEKGLLLDDTDTEKHDYIYARVSSNKQAQSGDLDRQVLFLIEQVSDLQKPIILKEVGSGLNDQRPKLMKLMEDVMDGKVNNVYVTYKDRLTRFGYHYLEKVFYHYGVRIVVVKDMERIKSIEQELAEDLMSLIASFSGTLYGLRSRGNRVLRKEAKNDEEK